MRNKQRAMEKKPPNTFLIKTLDKEDIPNVVSLAMELKNFFPEDAIQMIEFSLKEHRAIVGLLGAEIVGFLAYELREGRTAEILWMGVKEQFHGLGFGTMMLDYLENELREKGIGNLVTSTLSYTVDYKPFEKVRVFFYHRGFKAMAIQKDYYESGVDRLILAKNL